MEHQRQVFEDVKVKPVLNRRFPELVGIWVKGP